MKQYLSNFRLPFLKDTSDQHEDLRREDIDFRIPRLASKPRGFDVSPRRLQDQLHSLAMESNRQVQEGAKYLQQLSRIELKPQIRLNLSNTVLNGTAASITSLYRKYVSKGTSFPENSERMTELTSVITLLRELMLSYKIILAHDYELPLRKFNQQLHRVDFCSLRILELTMWLQRYLGVRFQKLSANDWKDINRIFFIYSGMFNTSDSVDMTEGLGLFKASGIISDVNDRRSVDSIYVSVQLFGLLDITTWPSKSIQVIEQYLHTYENLIGIYVGKPQDPCPDCVVTFDDLDSPPIFAESDLSWGCYINLSKLKGQISLDMEAIQTKKFIGEEEKKRLQPQGKVANLSENPGMLNLLDKKLSTAQRKHERKTLYGSRSVDVYSGLSECYRLLYEQLHNTHEKNNDSGLHNAAARHSSLLVDDPADELESQWLISNESDGGLLMRTMETKYMHVMEVGHVVAFRRNEEGEQEEAPQLGYITRLDRHTDGHVDVAIVKMSVQAEAVTMMEPGQDQNTQDLLPGILIKDLQAAWQLILPRYVSYVTGTPAIIKRQSDNIPVRLGNAAETKNGFIMFEVRSPVLK